MSKMLRDYCRRFDRVTIQIHVSGTNAEQRNQPRKAGTMTAAATAKRISAGEYEYRGYRIARDWYGDWIVYEQRNGWDGVTILEPVEALETLAGCKRAIDRWKNN